jgi:hypothetical protein
MLGFYTFAAMVIAGSTATPTPTPVPPMTIKVITSATYSTRTALLYDTFVNPSQIYVGDTPALIIGLGQIISALVLTITRPDGSRYSPASPVINNAGTKYSPDSFIVYIFAPGEISQAGKWIASIKTSSINSAVAAFTASSAPS